MRGGIPLAGLAALTIVVAGAIALRDVGSLLPAGPGAAAPASAGEQAAWQQRVAAYEAARNAIEQDPGLDPAARAQATRRLREASFAASGSASRRPTGPAGPEEGVEVR